jgi:ATP-dependent helicase/nuclease subunit B
MFTFLFGRSGSGKTEYIIDRIKDSVSLGKKTYLLVPEQQVFVSECMLADLPPSSALCFEVISFSRLCQMVFGQYGGLTDESVGTGVRNLIMWHSLREVSSQLKQYGNVKAEGALGAMMLSAVDELHANSITPEACERASQLCSDPTLAGKLYDISLIYANFNRNIEERLGEDAGAFENRLYRLADVLREHDFFAGSHIYIDSFTSFTGEQYAVLREIIKGAEQSLISFTYERGAHYPHTNTVSDTVKKLTRFVNENHIEHCDVTLKENRRTSSDELCALERYLWDFSLRTASLPSIDDDQRGDIDMNVCFNEYEEIWLAALNIIKEHKRGVKFSDIALIMRDPESKKGMIDAVFEQLNIPYFYSENTDLSATAVARLVLSALRCISHGFTQSDVLTLLKTGLLGINAHDADLFEDYCYTWSINGKTFLDDVWSMNPDGYTIDKSRRGDEILLAANRVRSAIIPPLSELKQELAAAEGDVEHSCRALYSYLDKIHLAENLSDMAELSLSSGNLKEAGELLRIYDFLISALTRICTVMSGTQMNVEELSSAIEIMLRNTDIGSVPALSDYVTVGSAATLRVENVKVALLIGLCEGEFPANYSDRGILGESDKRIMEELGISLSSREVNITSDELFYAYRAMSKPSDKLYLSTCRQSVSGRALEVSSAWNRVKFLFPYIKIGEFDLERVRDIADIMSSGDAPDDQRDIAVDADALTADNAVEIDPLYVRMIFGDKLRLTKSRISTFVGCPYRYWCEYVLKLREQKEAAVSYADSGTIIHYVLENILKKLRREDGSLEKIDDAELVGSVDDILIEYINGISCPLPSSVMYSFSRIRDLAIVMVKSVLDEFDKSKFGIVAFEQSIREGQDGALMPMEIPVDSSEGAPVVSLGGVIDRIDCYEDENCRYIRVVDYKTGSHKYNVDKIKDGEDLQLPAYLFTATLKENEGFFGDGQKPVFPASALFLSAAESDGKVKPTRSGFILGEQDILRAASENMDPEVLAGIKFKNDGTLYATSRAAVSREQIAEIDTTLREAVSTTAQNMYSGKAPRTPSRDACAYCTLKASCPVADKSN